MTKTTFQSENEINQSDYWTTHSIRSTNHLDRFCEPLEPIPWKAPNPNNDSDAVNRRGGGAQRGPSPAFCMLFFMSCRVSLSVIRLALPRNPTPIAKPVSPTLRASRLLVRFNSVSSVSTLFSMPERRPFVRLPTDVYPVNYGLRLKPDLVDFTFEGKLEAAVEVMLNPMPCSPSSPSALGPDVMPCSC